MSDLNPYSDLPGTATQTPAQDELEAQRTFPPSQQPFPRIPSIPTPKAQPKATGGGGGLNMDMLMPLLLMAAPFLEAHQPGYGMGLVSGVLQHQSEQAAVNRNTILTMAKEFANTPAEQIPVVKALMKSQGLTDEQITSVISAFPIFRDPNYALHEQYRQTQTFLAPEMVQSQLTGKPFDPTQMPAPRFEALQTAVLGALPSYGVTGKTPGEPGAGELGTRTPPIAPQEGRVVQRGAAQGPQLTDYIAGYRVREGMNPAAQLLLTTLQGRVNTGTLPIDQAVRILDTSPYFINPKDDAARFEGRVNKVQTRLETLAGSGQLRGDALTQAVATADAALRSDARNSGQKFGGLDTATIQAKLPKPPTQSTEESIRAEVAQYGPEHLSRGRRIIWDQVIKPKEPAAPQEPKLPMLAGILNEATNQATREILGRTRGGKLDIGVFLDPNATPEAKSAALRGGGGPMTADEQSQIQRRAEEIYRYRINLILTPQPRPQPGAPLPPFQLTTPLTIGPTGTPGPSLAGPGQLGTVGGAQPVPTAPARPQPAGAAPPKTITRAQIAQIALRNRMNAADVLKQYQDGGYTISP